MLSTERITEQASFGFRKLALQSTMLIWKQIVKAILRIVWRCLLLLFALGLATYAFIGWRDHDTIVVVGRVQWLAHIHDPGCFFVSAGYILIALFIAICAFQRDGYRRGDNFTYDVCLAGLLWAGFLISFFGLLLYPEAQREYYYHRPPALHGN